MSETNICICDLCEEEFEEIIGEDGKVLKDAEEEGWEFHGDGYYCEECCEDRMSEIDDQEAEEMECCECGHEDKLYLNGCDPEDFDWEEQENGDYKCPDCCEKKEECNNGKDCLGLCVSDEEKDKEMS